MGYRTVVIFLNDHSSEWLTKPDLGQEILQASSYTYDTSVLSKANLGYARVVQCTHADTQTLGIFEHYSFQPLLHSSWGRDEDQEGMNFRMLQAAADSLGYNLVRKRTKK